MSEKSNSMVIRRLEQADRVQWQSLWTSYLTFYKSAVEADVYDTLFGRLLGDDPQDYSAFVAELDGQLVGLVHYVYHRHCWKIENTCYLQDLYAAPEARGTGVGRALIEAVYTAADAAHAPSVYWTTQGDNITARHLYDRIGDLTPFIKYQRVL